MDIGAKAEGQPQCLGNWVVPFTELGCAFDFSEQNDEFGLGNIEVEVQIGSRYRTHASGYQEQTSALI